VWKGDFEGTPPTIYKDWGKGEKKAMQKSQNASAKIIRSRCKKKQRNERRPRMKRKVESRSSRLLGEMKRKGMYRQRKREIRPR